MSKIFSLTFASLLFLAGCIGITGVIIFKRIPLLSPVTAHPEFQYLRSENAEKSTTPKVVYGFLPFWNIRTAVLEPELTHLSYFSLTISKDGSILEKTEDGQTDQGFHKLGSEEFLQLSDTHLQEKKKVEIVLAQFNKDDIETFLGSPKAQQKLITSLDSLLQAYPLQGINLDIEYFTDATPELRGQYVEFVRKLDQHLQKKYPKVALSIDVSPAAVRHQQIWDIPQLEPSVDYIIVMSYDFHRKSSSVAGPVAPLFGGQKLWNNDVTQLLQDFVKVVPSKKILLGVPFYGYAWQTTSLDAQATVYPKTGQMASFQQVQNLLHDKQSLGLQEHWNEDALSPYLTFVKNNHNYVLYYENSRSLSYKIDLVNQLDLGGIAIWALGYDQGNRELWDIIQKKM
jgi:spore germination protein YaaH